MKRFLVVLLVIGIFLGYSTSSIDVAKAGVKTVTYKNCTEVNKVYKGGIARSSTVKNKGGKTKYKPYVSLALYDANKKSDRDKDLIACER